jgi:hypothetical protein
LPGKKFKQNSNTNLTKQPKALTACSHFYRVLTIQFAAVMTGDCISRPCQIFSETSKPSPSPGTCTQAMSFMDFTF